MRILWASSSPSCSERWSSPPCTTPRASSARSRSAPVRKSLVPARSCRELPSSKSSTARTCPTPEMTSRLPRSRATMAAQPLKACGPFRSSPSSSRSTRPSTSCSSFVSHEWILEARSGMSFVWKFLAHQSAASALRRPWKSANAEAGVSTKLSGNFRARRAIFGSSLSRTVRSSLLPLRTALAPPARAATANSALLCGVSTSCHCFVFSSCIRYCPIRLPSCAKYTLLRGSHSSSSSKRVQPSPGGINFSCLMPLVARGSTNRPSSDDSTVPAISCRVHLFLSRRCATRLTPASPSSWKALPSTSLSLTASGFVSR
mmetsp:Transcript_105874/g.326673  ORF Transcript_105874/g.326673 Transcript_105874/m.326673 type:complete len:317 (+) Transcript_105874:1205-2155(+)